MPAPDLVEITPNGKMRLHFVYIGPAREPEGAV